MCGLKTEEFYFTEFVNRFIFSVSIHFDIGSISWQSQASVLVCPSLPVPVGAWQGQTLAVKSSPAMNGLLDRLGASPWLTGHSWLTGDGWFIGGGWLVGMVLCFRISGLLMNTFLSRTAGRGAHGQYRFSSYPCFCCLLRCLRTRFSTRVSFVTTSTFF